MKQYNSHTIGKWAAPVSVAIAYGWVIYRASLADGIPWYLGIIGAITTAIALEVVGMGAGENSIRFTVARHWLAVPSWLSLIAYTAIGTYEFWNTPFQFIFAVAFLVYLGSGMDTIYTRNTAAKADVRADMKEARAAELAAQMARESEAARLVQELKLAELAAKERVQMAKLAPQIAADVPQKAQVVKVAPQNAKRAPRKNELTAQDRAQIAASTTAEVQGLYGVSERTAQVWRAEFATLTQTSEGVRAD